MTSCARSYARPGSIPHSRVPQEVVLALGAPANIERPVVNAVRQAYVNYMLSTTRLRSPSGGSDASDRGAEPEEDQAAKEWLAKLAESRAARQDAA